MTLLQHSSLYESMASVLQSAQKKFLGKALVGSELCPSASAHVCSSIVCTYRAYSFRSSASGAALGSTAGLAMMSELLSAREIVGFEAAAQEKSRPLRECLFH